MRIARSCLAMLSALAMISCGGGGGHGSPTDPGPQYPTVAGAWIGSWTPIVTPVTVQLNLTQASVGQISGTMTALGTTLDVTGSVTTALGITWRNVQTATGCGTLTGTGQLNALSASQFTGTIDLDSRSCLGGNRFIGPANFTRGSSIGSGVHGDPQDLAEALERGRR